MVRYTQDTWKNDSPSNREPLGRRSVPGGRLELGSAGKSFAVSLNQNLGSKAVNSLQFSYSANKITVTRGEGESGLNARINQLRPPSSRPAATCMPATRHPVFWGGGYQALWNEAPFHNNKDLFVLKDDYTLVFGKHMLKAGALVSINQKNEDVGGFGSFENSAFWGSGGLPGWGATSGNLLADFLIKDMTFGFSENSGQRPLPQRWRDLEMHVADSWKATPRLTLDYGLRYSLFFNPYADDDKIMSFDPASSDPALGNDPCNGLLQAPGADWCGEAGLRGGSEGPNRSLFPQSKNNFAPRLGLAWDVNGNGKSAVRAGLGLFYLRERLSPGLNVGNNPPFIRNINGLRTLDSNVDPCGCFAPTAAGPNSGREQRAANPHNWQWNLSYQREILAHTTLDIGYVANKGYDLLRTQVINAVVPGDRNRNGVDDRLDYMRSQGGARRLRPYEPGAAPPSRCGTTTANRPITRCRRRSSAAGAARRSRCPTHSRTQANSRSTTAPAACRQTSRSSTGAISRVTSGSPTPIAVTCSTRRWSSPPPMDDRSELVEAWRLGARRDHAGRWARRSTSTPAACRVSTAARPGPATPTTSGPTPPVPTVGPTTAITPNRSSIPRP